MKVILDKGVHDIRWKKIFFGGYEDTCSDAFIESIKNDTLRVKFDWIEGTVFLDSTTRKNASVEISFVYFVLHCKPVGLLSTLSYKFNVLLGGLLLCTY